MTGKNGNFSQSELARMMAQPETRALLQRLQSMDSNTLQHAVREAMKGNTAQAQRLLTPLMQDEQVQSLAKQVRDTHGGV